MDESARRRRTSITDANRGKSKKYEYHGSNPNGVRLHDANGLAVEDNEDDDYHDDDEEEDDDDEILSDAVSATTTDATVPTSDDDGEEDENELE